MSVIHPILLGGLVLVGLPVLIHLLMRQKPRRLPFPALRFLQQRFRANRRSLQLRRLLLLAVRMLVVAMVCLALSRPVIRWTMAAKFWAEASRQWRRYFSIDTSCSMEYRRKDEAGWRRPGYGHSSCSTSCPQAAGQPYSIVPIWAANGSCPWPWPVNASVICQLRPANAPVTGQLRHAYRLLNDVVRNQEGVSEVPARILLVFSDRTLACWDQRDVKDLQPASRNPTMFIDVGVENPQDMAITNLELSPS